MIIFSILSLSIKYSEGFLAIKFRKIENDFVIGGPFSYIEYGMGKKYRFLSKSYALFGLLAATLGIGTMTQSNGITDAFRNTFISSCNTWTNLKISILIGAVIAIISGLVIFGGTKRITRICESVIPLVTVIYIFSILLIIFNNISLLSSSVELIIKSAFNIKSFTTLPYFNSFYILSKV
jgi:AGCS family alanine or glycine:cation symporter